MTTKKCNTCGIDKPLDEFYSKQIRCKQCIAEHNRSPEIRARRAENTANYRKGTSRDKEYADRRGMTVGEWKSWKNGKDRAKRIPRYKQSFLAMNARQAWMYWLKVKASASWLDGYYQASDKPWFDHRLSDAEKYVMRYRLDSEYQLKERMRRQVNKAKKRDGIADVMRSAIKTGGASPKVERELGYTIADLMIHIEKQFTRRMTWNEYKKGRIHIDHIMPQSSFDLTREDEWISCWALTNLMPLWAGDNLKKRDRIDNLL